MFKIGDLVKVIGKIGYTQMLHGRRKRGNKMGKLCYVLHSHDCNEAESTSVF